MSAIALSLRLGRWGIAGFGTLAFVSTLIQALGFYRVAGHTEAEREVFAQNIGVLASRFTVLLAPPMRADTVGGYVAWRAYGALAILFAVWALVAASGAARGDEERGIVEAELATGLRRVGLLASRVSAFVLGSFVAALAAAVAVIVGARSAGESASFGPGLEAAIVLAALAACCYTLTLLIAQLTAARLATATAGAVLLALFLVNSLSRTFSWLATAKLLSPFHYYELSQPLVPGGSVDVRATVILAATALVASAAAAVAFGRRDLGSPLIAPRLRLTQPSFEPRRAPWWRVPVLRRLNQERFGLLAWATGMAGLAVIFVSMTQSIVQPLLAISQVARFLTAAVHGSVVPSFLGYFWFTTVQLLFAGFAIAQVARWSADDGDGRLGFVISQPFSRAAVIVERAAVLTGGAAFIAVVSGVALGIAARAQGVHLEAARLAEASLLLVPFTLVFAGAGSLLAAWIPRAAVGVLGGITFAGYLDTQVGQYFSWPAWLQDLSAFKLFGNPLTDGIDGRNLALMVLIALAGFGSSILAMQGRDVGA